MQYRHKPKTIMVNGFEVPAPLDEMPQDGDVVWVPNPLNRDFVSYLFFRGTVGALGFARGLLHTTNEAAVAHAKAMLGIDPGEV